jgi:hypothetical protein
MDIPPPKTASIRYSFCHNLTGVTWRISLHCESSTFLWRHSLLSLYTRYRLKSRQNVLDKAIYNLIMKQNNCLNVLSIGIPFLIFLVLPKYFVTLWYIPIFERYCSNSARPALSDNESDVFSILSIYISYEFFLFGFFHFCLSYFQLIKIVCFIAQ